VKTGRLAQGLRLVDEQLKKNSKSFLKKKITTKKVAKLITITSNYPNYMQEIRVKKRKGKEKLGFLPVSTLLTSLA